MSIKRPATTHILWDGYGRNLTMLGGMAAFQTAMNTSMTGGPNWKYHRQIFRHNHEGIVQNTPIGPNALFADGHVQPRIDLFGLTEDHVNF
jgi:prepilin-type processing-associated H-X9-DG protein